MSPTAAHKNGHGVIDPKEVIDGISKPTTVCWIFFLWFCTTGVVGLLFPGSMILARGVVLGSRCDAGATAWLNVLQQSQVLQSLLMAAFHLVVLRNGAIETRITSTHHMQAVRTLLLTDTVWISFSCVFIWTTLLPEMKENGWHHSWVLYESFLLAALGLVAFVESRGDAVVALGGLVKAQANAAHVTVPEFHKRNYGLLAWGAIAAAGAPVLLMYPESVTDLYGIDTLNGSCQAASNFLAQIMGLCLLNQAACILAILSSGVLALQYCATRLLWVWSFGLAVFTLGLQQILGLLHLKVFPIYIDVSASLLVCFLAKRSMEEFANVGSLHKMTGRA
eukprot:TRINITY_DN46077_c0_g1_i1.p1 TRINITY_DN46077_c0_g1~~TRINITY_DN46077_c0_g1_i1.p1  ORF type:complete len:359 (+),score=73.65 TRINITY_DN46077_c0_g1_i1:71-1078(+)